MKISEYREAQINTRSKNKFGNIRTEYAGRMYDSVKEAEYARMLDICRRETREKMRVVDWQPQIKFPLEVNGLHIADYILDFKVTYADGRVEYVDVKGGEATKTAVYKLKKKLMKAIYNIELIEI